MTLMSPSVQGFGCRLMATMRLCTLKGPAFEKRQGRKSRSGVRRRCGWLYGDLAGASGLGCVVMIHTRVRLDRDPAGNERVARRAIRICGTSGCDLSGSRRAWALRRRADENKECPGC